MYFLPSLTSSIYRSSRIRYLNTKYSQPCMSMAFKISLTFGGTSCSSEAPNIGSSLHTEAGLSALTGISKCSRKNKLSDAHNLLTLLICSVCKNLMRRYSSSDERWISHRLCYQHEIVQNQVQDREMKVQLVQISRTVTPYLRAIPCRVSVADTICFTKLSVRVMCLAVLPYFFRVLPVSRMHLRSSISLAPFRSIVVGLQSDDVRQRIEHTITSRRLSQRSRGFRVIP